MEIRAARPVDRNELAAFAASLQRRADRHCAYLGLDADTIAEEMVAEDDDWTVATTIATHRGELVGWLMGSHDLEIGRVWWFGPFIDVEGGAPDDRWSFVADTLYADAAARLPAGIDSEEIAVDDRNQVTRRWAARRGFVEGTASVTLRRESLDVDPPVGPWVLRPIRPDDAATVGRLHDDLFPDSHLTGRALVADTAPHQARFVAELDGEQVGYVAAERQPDGAGYIDFLGVAPAVRRRGLGTDLVAAALGALAELGCSHAHLTVREDNTAARSVYARTGFAESRLIRPLRRTPGDSPQTC